MLKSQAKSILIKDIVIAVIAIGGFAIFAIVSEDMPVSAGIFLGLFVGGLPFGWRWASKIFKAFSLMAVIAKALISLVLGWIALPVTIIKDIIAFVNAKD